MIISGVGALPPRGSLVTVGSSPTYYKPRRADEIEPILDINGIIEKYAKGKDYRQLQGDPLYKNMEYIREHPPMTIAEKEKTDNELLYGILDAISYASAVASFIPFPPLQIGGMLGYTATNAARQFAIGDTHGGLRNLNQMSRNLYNVRRQIEYSNKKNQWLSKNRR